MKYWSVTALSGSLATSWSEHLEVVNIQVEPDQPDIGGVTIYIVTSTKEPDEVIQSSDSDSDDSDTEVPVVRGRGSYGLRPKPTRTQE